MNRKDWNFEEEIKLLELMVSNGRKWALISKIITGRNEHTVKNKYISILRLLKKHGKVVNSNDFQEVLDTFNLFKRVQLDLHPNKIEEISKLSLQKSQSSDEFGDIPSLFNIQKDIINLELSSTLDKLIEKPQENVTEISEENDFLIISKNNNRRISFDL